MKISLTDTEAVNMLSILNERKAKYTKLAGLAKGRTEGKFKKNAERLMNRHNKKVEVAQGLIMKIAGQL
jgi:hypothetical protein